MAKKSVATLLVLSIASLIVPGQPCSALSAQTQIGGRISGSARDQAGRSLVNYTARLRNVNTGQLVGITTTTANGTFSFSGLNAASYIVEIVNPDRAVVGTTGLISLAPGAATATGLIVTATAGGAATGGAAAAGVLGLFSNTARVIIGAAVAAGVTAAVVTTKETASPSQ